MQTILVNILICCAIILLVLLILGAVMLIVTLVNIRRTVKDVTDKVHAVTSLIDVVAVMTGAMDLTKSAFRRKLPGKGTLIAFAAGLRKGLEVLLKK